jgi:hypothetical protein
MKHPVVLGLALATVIAAAALSSSKWPTENSVSADLQIEVQEKNPWTHLRMNNSASDFRFAIISDRTGGHRSKVFARAVERLNLLQPEFVLSVGDLIEGYTEEKEKLDKQWAEFNGFVKKLQMPFFYVVGNHDLVNPVEGEKWQEQFGRTFYHFVYRGVLFLLLSSEDPKSKDVGVVTPAQIAWVKKTLGANANVRWTIVCVHRPLWTQTNLEKNGWLEVEKLLEGRQYTVFAGHLHRYHKYVRQGMDYYQLATTGGASRVRGLRYGEFDHITWVTMKKDGPLLANVMLDGVFNERMAVSEVQEPGVSTKNRKPVHACNVKLSFQGKPVSSAIVVFHSYNERTKKYARVADGMTEDNGATSMSTYTAFDGVPAGDYTVTLTWADPRFDDTGKPMPNKLPARYAKPDTSPLNFTVREGDKNDVEFQLDR